MQVVLGPGHIVLDGDPAPPLPKGHSPPFFGPYLFGQMAAWIMMPLGMEIGLGPGNVALDGDQAPAPQFSWHVYYGHGRPSQLLLSFC